MRFSIISYYHYPLFPIQTRNTSAECNDFMNLMGSFSLPQFLEGKAIFKIHFLSHTEGVKLVIFAGEPMSHLKSFKLYSIHLGRFYYCFSLYSDESRLSVCSNGIDFQCA